MIPLRVGFFIQPTEHTWNVHFVPAIAWRSRLVELDAVRFSGSFGHRPINVKAFGTFTAEDCSGNLISIRGAFEKPGIVFESDGKFVGARLKMKRAS